MLNLIPLSELVGPGVAQPESYDCPLCHQHLSSSKDRALHLERAHDRWAYSMMSGFLRLIPRENG